MIWTTTNDLVTPPMSWSSHPELGRGRQTIIGNPKALYPLEKGNKVAFGTRGNSENLPTGWRNKEICLVIGQKDIAVTAGDFTTFHISCKRKDHTEDLYYAPVVQNYVLRVRKFANNRSQKELVSVNLGNDRTKTLPVKITRPFKERRGLIKKIKVRSKISAKMGMPSSGNPEVDALIARLEAMITRFEKVSNDTKIGTKKVKGVSSNKGKYGIHLASYRTVKGAKKGWRALKRKFPRELKNLTFGTTEFDTGKRKGTFIRLMGLSFQTKKSANKFCVRLKSKRQYCKGERAKP